MRNLDDWVDVARVPQDDGPHPVVPIAYSAEYTEVMDYFRAVLTSDERSARALALTEDVLALNAANYTAWHFRRRCLEALGADLRRELEFISAMAEDNPKNYQIWYHRHAIVERLGDPSAELAFVAQILAEDSKNYHAWSHRQWVTKAHGLWSCELDFVAQMLDHDLRNNSAWNHRWFVVHNSEEPMEEAIVRREVAFTFKYIDLCANNESPWVYLLGYLRQPYDAAHATTARVCCDLVEQKCEQMMQNGHADLRHLLRVLLEIFETRASDASIKRAVEIAQHLADVDPIRAKYWERRLSEICAKHGLTPPVAAVSDPVEVEEIGAAAPATSAMPPPPPDA